METIAKYDFEEDALGLGAFINETMGGLSDDEVVVYVTDAEGRQAQQATFIRETLTDGSTVVNLVIRFL